MEVPSPPEFIDSNDDGLILRFFDGAVNGSFEKAQKDGQTSAHLVSCSLSLQTLMHKYS